MKRLYFFTRIGGKHRVAAQIVGMFPPEGVDTYVEPFAGSAQVFLYMASPSCGCRLLQRSTKIVLNDVDRDIYFLWKDVKHVDPKKMEAMPWKGDRSLFYHFKNLPFSPHEDPHQRLFRNLYLSYYSFSGDKSGGYAAKPQIRGKHFLTTLPLLQQALKKAVILNKDYRKVMEKYDSPTTFFYIDPPYMGKENLYEGHGVPPLELLETCRKLKGKFVMSYNRDPHVEQLFAKHFHLYVIEVPYISTIQKSHVQELLITNYAFSTWAVKAQDG